MISKGYIYHIVWVRDVNFQAPTLESVFNVNAFPNVFIDTSPGIPLEREINFGIDVMTKT